MIGLPIIVALLGIFFMRDYAKWYNPNDFGGNVVPAILAVLLLTLSGLLWTLYFTGNL